MTKHSRRFEALTGYILGHTDYLDVKDQVESEILQRMLEAKRLVQSDVRASVARAMQESLQEPLKSNHKKYGNGCDGASRIKFQIELTAEL